LNRGEAEGRGRGRGDRREMMNDIRKKDEETFGY
jgi:hypothetical protein